MIKVHSFQDLKAEADKGNITTTKGKIPFAVDQYDLKGNFIQTWYSVKDAAEAIGVDWTGIASVVRGRQKTSGGFIWRKSTHTNIRILIQYTPEQTILFSRLLLKSRPVIYACILSFQWARYYDCKEEIFQRSALKLWKSFGTWIENDQSVSWNSHAWRTTFQEAVRYKESGSYKSFYNSLIFDEISQDSHFVTGFEDPHSEENDFYFSVLEDMIQSLAEDEICVIKAYLATGTITKAAEIADLSYNGFVSKFERIQKKLRELAPLFIKKRNPGLKISINTSEKQKKLIGKYDSRGNLIDTYVNLASATKDGFSASKISEVIHNKRGMHKGYFWKYVDRQVANKVTA